MGLQSWGLPAWTLAALLFALTTGGPVPWFLFKFLVALHLLGAAWAWLLARGLDAQVRVDRAYATAGDRVQLEVFIHNESILPVPRLAITLPAWGATENPAGGTRRAPHPWRRPYAGGRGAYPGGRVRPLGGRAAPLASRRAPAGDRVPPGGGWLPALGGRGPRAAIPSRGAPAAQGAVFYRSLGPLGNLVHRETVALPRRGRYTLGPVLVELQEPLGLFRVRRTIEAEPFLTVYPRPVPVDDLPVLPRQPFGRQRVDTRAWQDPASLADVRPFQPGDNPKHIHWKVSARLDELHVKEFDLRATTDCFLFLDLCADGDATPDEPAAPAAETGAGDTSGENGGAGSGRAFGSAAGGLSVGGGPEASGWRVAAAAPAPAGGAGGGAVALDLAEGVAGVAAGVAALALDHELVVAAAAHTDRLHRLPPGRGPQHYRRLLEWLVDVNQPGTMALAEFLVAQRGWLTPRSAVLVVTRHLDRRLGRVLVQFRSQGHAVGVWLVHAAGEGPAARPAPAGRLKLAGSQAARVGASEAGGGGGAERTGGAGGTGEAGGTAGAGGGGPATGVPGIDPALLRWLVTEGISVQPVSWPADTGGTGQPFPGLPGIPGRPGLPGLTGPARAAPAMPPLGTARRVAAGAASGSARGPRRWWR